MTETRPALTAEEEERYPMTAQMTEALPAVFELISQEEPGRRREEELKEQEKQKFKAGEEEYEHLLIDLKALGLGLDHLPAQEDQTMFSPGEESDAHGALDIMMEGEEKVGVPGSLLALQDMDWDDNVWCGMEWEEGETLCPAPTTWKKRLSLKGGEVSLRGGEVSNDCPDDRSITNSVRVNIARGDKNEKGRA